MMQQSQENYIFNSWTYNLDESRFLFRDGSSGYDWFNDPQIFEQVTGLARLTAERGRSFSILNAPPSDIEGDEIIHTRGMFLSDKPAVLSGISELIVPEYMGYVFEPERTEIIRLLNEWNEGTARNAVHALKAPISRIKGISSILAEELSEQHHQELVSFLQESGKKLSQVANYLLGVENNPPKSPTIGVGKIADRIRESAFLQIGKKIPITDTTNGARIDASLVSLLERLITNIITFETDLGYAQSLRFERDNTQTVSIYVEHALKAEYAWRDLAQVQSEDLPGGSVELVRASSEVLVVRSGSEERLRHRVILPLLS